MKEQIQFYKNKLSFEMDPSDLFEAFENKEDIVAIDARQDFGYKKEHIPGAINLPHRDMTLESTAHLDKSKTYVCYCDGIGCNASTKGALKMSELGFSVKELMGGIEWWKFDGYATEGDNATAGSLIQCAC
ncbi:rhodanese-like domain-containing protein [Reichenbachiella sp.]|uniref:rhodanese-like domain-containing protein n=1 Tax=Reichenbachiella sp. TaxID=2184521 RepID=UPI003BAF5CE3